jgi:small GTP-binding protein
MSSRFVKPAPRKVVLVGDANVGKTSLLLQLTDHMFRQETTPTVSSGCFIREFPTTNGPMPLQIWDTAGEERYRSITRLYAQGAIAAIIVFDTSVSSTFASIPSWVDTIRDMTDTDPVFFVVGNKVDLTPRDVDGDTVAQYCQENRLISFDVSAKTGFQVDLLFAEVAEQVGRRTMGVTSPPVLSEADSGCCRRASPE